MREASVAVDRNVSYLHSFLERNCPKVLSYRDAHKLAELLGCQAEELHHAERPPRRKAVGTRRRRGVGPDEGPVPLVGIPEFDVEASAGPGALAGEFVTERARWFLPEGMIRYEGGSDPGAIRVLRVRGESMEPELSEGDRLLVDTTCRSPATGEMVVLWDGCGLVVKRIEPVHESEAAPVLRVKSANPDYADYTCLAEDVHIVGKVLWTVRKV
ncbi:MAG: hypothetical protein OXI81_08695 [Paracoccaceae bacterium]|nr:hypothetical protein [Paracoccaceae bacterium]